MGVESIESMVMADGQVTIAEVLAAADVVIELKYALRDEKNMEGGGDPAVITHLEREIDVFNGLYRRVLAASDKTLTP